MATDSATSNTQRTAARPFGRAALQRKKMPQKRPVLNSETVTMLRQVTGRYASKFTPGGREKRVTRTVPSLPKLKCLEEADFKETYCGPQGTRLSDPRP